MNSKMCITFIPKKDLQLVEKDLKQTKWGNILKKTSCVVMVLYWLQITS